jgi:hypothetical protein
MCTPEFWELLAESTIALRPKGKVLLDILTTTKYLFI